MEKNKWKTIIRKKQAQIARTQIYKTLLGGTIQVQTSSTHERNFKATPVTKQIVYKRNKQNRELEKFSFFLLHKLKCRRRGGKGNQVE